MPAFIGGFGNWFVPLMIGAPDMAFPRLNNVSFWVLIPSGALLDGRLDVLGRRAMVPASERAGRSMPPHRTSGHPGPAVDMVHLRAPSRRRILDSRRYQLSSRRFFNMRAPGMTLHKMPLFVWAMLGDRPSSCCWRCRSWPAPSPCCSPTATSAQRSSMLTQRRRSDPLSAPVLVLRPPGGLHPHPAGLRRRQPRRLDLFATSRCLAISAWPTPWWPSA